jgi:hypothetical protein
VNAPTQRFPFSATAALRTRSITGGEACPPSSAMTAKQLRSVSGTHGAAEMKISR